MSRLNYYQLSGFENVYLEDSYVLDIQVNQFSVELHILAVLNEKHQLYHPPLPDELYCYKKACILFPNVKKTTWVEKSMIPFKDANGDIDYGNIDIFYLEEGSYHLMGDWGELCIVSDSPVLDFEN